MPIPTKLPFVPLLLRNHPVLLRLAHLDCLKECSVLPSAIAFPPKVLPSGVCLWFPSAPAVSQVPGPRGSLQQRVFLAVSSFSRLSSLPFIAACSSCFLHPPEHPSLAHLLCLWLSPRFLALFTSWTRGSVSVANAPSPWLRPSSRAHDCQPSVQQRSCSPALHRAEVQTGEAACCSHSRLFLASVQF